MSKTKTNKNSGTKKAAEKQQKNGSSEKIEQNPWMEDITYLMSVHGNLVRKMVACGDPMFVSATLHSLHATQMRVEMDMVYQLVTKKGFGNGKK